MSGLAVPVTATVQAAKPDSNFGGVQIGIIAGGFFRRLAPGVEDILKWTVQSGLSVIELDVDFFEPFIRRTGGASGATRRRAGTAG